MLSVEFFTQPASCTYCHAWEKRVFQQYADCAVSDHPYMSDQIVHSVKIFSESFYKQYNKQYTPNKTMCEQVDFSLLFAYLNPYPAE